MAPARSGLLVEVAEYYADRYRRFGDSARGMDWNDESSQYLRFERLTSAFGAGSSPEVIDVGCGNGELLAFLRRRGLKPRYTGVDVCEPMVAACRQRFGPATAVLGAAEDLDRLGLKADFVLASGIFNVRQETPPAIWEEYLERSVAAMYQACRVAAVFNVLTTWVGWRRDHLFYFDPAALPGLARRCGARRFVLDHGYPLFEMTVHLLR